MVVMHVLYRYVAKPFFFLVTSNDFGSKLVPSFTYAPKHSYQTFYFSNQYYP